MHHGSKPGAYLALIAGVAALASLTACSKKTETAATGTAANTTATASASSTAPAGNPITSPHRKPGLWEISVSNIQAGQTTSLCVDETTEAKEKFWGAESSKECSEQRVTPHPGGGWDFHAVCNMGESGTVTSDGSATGDFGSHYSVEVTSTTSGSPMAQANGAHKMKIDATWKGPCPAGMKGGDIRLANGMIFNPANGAGAAAAAGHMNRADIAKMRAQALEMARQMKAQEKQ